MDTQIHPISGLWALALCCVLFYSLVGWGRVFAKLARIDHVGTGLAVSLGLVFQCTLGSVLNELHLIYTPVLFGILGVGLLAAARSDRIGPQTPRRALLFWRNQSFMYKAVALVVFVLLLVRLISFIRVTAYNPWDDFQAYLLFPVKMLQLHHLPADPFSQRRVISSVGYGYYLQDLFLILAPLKNQTLVDGGLGVLLLATVAWDLSKELELSRRQAVCFMLLAAFVKQIYFNLSFAWLPCGLFLAMALIALRKDLREVRPRVQPICLGMVGAAATGLKNSYLAYVGVFILLFYVALAFVPSAGKFEASTPVRTRLSFCASSLGYAALGFLAALGLWMVDLHHYAGTFFFPVLGHGYEFSSYHLLPSRVAHSPRALLKSLAFGVPLLVLGLAEALWARLNRVSALTLVVTFGAALATVAVALGTGNDSVRRYSYPQIMVALLMLFPLVCFEVNHGRRVRSGFATKVTAVAIVLFGSLFDFHTEHFGFDPRSSYARRHLHDFAAGLRNHALNSSEELAEYRALQAAVPQNAVVLETVGYPYLLDNRRATYYEASLPALASPPPAPGWPILSDGEALGEWLRQHQVQYLMYSYADHAFQFDELMPKYIADPQWPLILHLTWIANLKAHAQYLELARNHRHVYDDGKIFLIDLNSPR